MYRPEHQCGVNSLLTVLVWSNSLLPADSTSQQEQSPPQGRAVWPRPNRSPEEIVIESQRQPKWFIAWKSASTYLFLWRLKLASEHRDTKLTDKADIPKKPHAESSTGHLGS